MPVSIRRKNILGGYGGEETPDPIPNSEAKLTSADGTAYCGRVGRRRPSRSRLIVGTFFVYAQYAYGSFIWTMLLSIIQIVSIEQIRWLSFAPCDVLSLPK